MTILDTAKLRAELPEAMAMWDAELRAAFHCPDWCQGDPQLHDVGLYYDGSARVAHDGPDFGGAFYGGGDTHPETGQVVEVSVRPGAGLEEGREDIPAARLREIAAAALAAAEWLDAHA
jgi:hypothetical protein